MVADCKPFGAIILRSASRHGAACNDVWIMLKQGSLALSLSRVPAARSAEYVILGAPFAAGLETWHA